MGPETRQVFIDPRRAFVAKGRDRHLDDLLCAVARRAQLRDAGVGGRFRELAAVRSADESMVGERRRRCAPEQARQPQLGRRGVEQVAAADDDPHALANVVDDDAQAIGMVAVPVAYREIAARLGDLPGARPDERVHPGLLAGPERRAQDRAVQAPLAAAAGAADAAPRPAVLGGPGAERGPGAVAAVEPTLLPERGERAGVGGLGLGVGLGDRPGVRDEAEPREVLADASVNAGRVRWPSWSSMRSRTRPPMARATPQVHSALAT